MTDDLPLSWLLAQQQLDLRPVTDTGDPQGAPRGFSVIQPTELADPREFLQPRAVVLTVGVSLADAGTDPFPDYVARLAEAGVSALGFGTGLYFRTVPPSLVAAARSHRIAVFEVPRHCAFISILNTVLEERSRRSRRDQEHLVDVQGKLSSAAVDGGMDALLTATATHLTAAVAVTDNDGRVHGHCDYAGHSAVADARREVGTTAGQRDGRWRITQRMTPQGERFHLITVTAGHNFTPHDRAVVRHAAGLADILLQRPAYLRRSRTALNTLAVQLLLGLDGGDRSTGRVLDDASDGDGRVRPVVVAADRASDLRRATAEADRLAAASGRHLFTTDLDAVQDDGPASTLFLFRGSRTVDDIAATVGGAAHHVRIAVGEPVGWRSVTLERVRRLETAARALPPGGCVGPYEAGTDWLEQPAVRTVLDRRAGETVDRLRTTGDDSLEPTLLSWLRSGAKVATTAAELGVHRHTVRSRLDRIARVCEVDLDDPVVRAELLLVAVTRR